MGDEWMDVSLDDRLMSLPFKIAKFGTVYGELFFCDYREISTQCTSHIFLFTASLTYVASKRIWRKYIFDTINLDAQLTWVHDLRSHVNNLISCVRDFKSCAHDFKSCAHDFKSCAHDLLSGGHDLSCCHIISRSHKKISYYLEILSCAL